MSPPRLRPRDWRCRSTSQRSLPEVLGDAERLRQILLNLVGNAVKFTREGGVRITATVTSNGGVEVAVSDTGIGISAETMLHIFEAFRQVDSSLTRRHGGVGTGVSHRPEAGRADGREHQRQQRTQRRLDLPPAPPGGSAVDGLYGDFLPITVLRVEKKRPAAGFAVGDHSGSDSSARSTARSVVIRRRLTASMTPSGGRRGSRRGRGAGPIRLPPGSASGSVPPRSVVPGYSHSRVPASGAGVSRATPWLPQTEARPRPAVSASPSCRPRSHGSHVPSPGNSHRRTGARSGRGRSWCTRP